MPIYEQGYRHIESVRRASRAPFLPIASTTFRLYFRKKWRLLPGLIVLLRFVLNLLPILLPLLALDAGTQNLPGPLGKNAAPTALTYFDFYTWSPVWFAVFLITMLAGAGVLADDVRANALELYFSRPVTRTQYLFGKLLGVLAVLSCFTLLPALWIWLVDVIANEDPGHFRAQLHLIPRIVLGGAALIVPLGMLVLAISATMRTARVATIAFATVMLVPRVVTELMASTLDDVRWRVLSPEMCQRRILEWVMGVPADRYGANLLNVRPTQLELSHALVVLGTVLLVCTIVCYRRVRPITVVAT